ncbi:MAG: VCBS repeat-containing protein [Actinobacteria bacterium]|nr:VCBS repeat-containing protein [Actinomycetota bacterium]
MPRVVSQSGGNSCNGQTATLPLLLPAWADTAGWYQADQYETIMSADIEGDGVKELLGRNASSLEVQRWSAPFQTAAYYEPGSTDPPVAPIAVPGQWVPSPVPGPPTPEINGFYDPSMYTTFRVANLDQDKADEIVVRTYNGVQVFNYTPGASAAPGSWQTTQTPVFADSPSVSWWHPAYYSTITTGDVNGDGIDEIIGRSPNGIQSFDVLSNGQVQQLENTPTTVMTDQEGWNVDNQYQTIRVADVNGDRTADLIGRGPNGLVVYTFASGAWNLQPLQPGPNAWTNNAGWTNQSWYSTIGTADLTGDGVADIYGRTKDGIDAWTFNGSTWTELVAPPSSTPSILTDAQGFDNEPYYATIQTATFADGSANPPAKILARSQAGVFTTNGGAAFFSLSGASFSGPTLTNEQFSDGNGWNQPVRYETLKTVQIAPGLDVLIGKDATGVRTYKRDGGQWVNPSSTWPAWSNVPAVKPPNDDQQLFTQQVDSYNYINQQYVAQTSGATGTIRDQFVNEEFTGLTSQNASTIKNMHPVVGKNVPRDVWDGVHNETLGWMQGVVQLQDFYFNSATGMQQLIYQTGIVADTGPNSPSQVQQYFSSNPAILALVADLIWGILGAVPGGDTLALAIMTSTFSLMGAGVSAGLGFVNPDGKAQTTGNQLNDALQNAFCSSVAFLQTSYAQIVGDNTPANMGDPGLLNVMSRLTIEGPLKFAPASGTGTPNPGSYLQLAASANNQRAIWVWQQFSANSDRSWRVGYCWGQGLCNSGFEDRVNDGYGIYYGTNYYNMGSPGCDYNISFNCDGYFYRVVSTDFDGVADCVGSSHNGDGAWKTLVDAGVGFNPDTLFMPRTQANRLVITGQPPTNSSLQQPIFMQNNNVLGILGWRVQGANCSV